MSLFGDYAGFLTLFWQKSAKFCKKNALFWHFFANFLGLGLKFQKKGQKLAFFLH